MTNLAKRWLIGGAVGAVLFGPALWQNVTKADEPARPSYQPAPQYHDNDYDSPSYGGTSDDTQDGSPTYVDPSAAANRLPHRASSGDPAGSSERTEGVSSNTGMTTVRGVLYRRLERAAHQRPIPSNGCRG
jgi:hypothetical protein